MKDYQPHIDINTAMSICITNGIKVYPIVSGVMFRVAVDDNGKIKTYDKLVTKSSIANAVAKTYRWYALQLKQKQDAKDT